MEMASTTKGSEMTSLNPAIESLHRTLTKRFWNKGEVRLEENGEVDEVVVHGVDVHVEAMSEDHYWVGLSGKQGRRMVLNFFRKGRTIHLTVEDDGFHSSGIAEGFKK